MLDFLQQHNGCPYFPGGRWAALWGERPLRQIGLNSFCNKIRQQNEDAEEEEEEEEANCLPGYTCIAIQSCTVTVVSIFLSNPWHGSKWVFECVKWRERENTCGSTAKPWQPIWRNLIVPLERTNWFRDHQREGACRDEMYIHVLTWVDTAKKNAINLNLGWSILSSLSYVLA